jgi:serine phosphatase RsbU (regulator of sigma subunit)
LRLFLKPHYADTASEASAPAPPAPPEPAAVALAEALAELALLRSEIEDLRILYESTIEHGEAIENDLHESNLLLQSTQRRLNDELAEATNYIRGIFPAPLEGTPSTDWYFEPSTELGGDSFGYHDIDADHMAVYLLDVCGHGVGAALLSVTVINVLRSAALAKTDFRDPAAVLAALNDTFPMEKQGDMYFTIWYGVLHKASRMLRYASGGHPPSLLLRHQGAGSRHVIQLSSNGISIGVMPGADYEAKTVEVQDGDRLLLLSDGVYEVETSPGVALEFDDFIGFVAAPGGDQPASIFRWIKSYVGEPALPDDFTLLRLIF